MIAVYKKEMRSYLTQMMGYIFLAFILIVVAIGFVMSNIGGENANFNTALSGATLFLFIVIPTLTMRLFSEEARQKTDQLLVTSPLSVTSIVLGKFFAAVTLFLIAMSITTIMPIMLNNYATLPLSRIVGTYIGFTLLGISCIAVGVFVSVLTDNQIIAAVITVGTIFFMFILDILALSAPTSTFASFIFVAVVIAMVVAILYNATRNVIATLIVAALSIGIAAGLYLFNNLIYDGIILRVLLWFSLFDRYGNFELGIINTSDIVYYVSFSMLFVYLTANVIEKRRWR